MYKILIAEQIPSSNKGEATLMYGICKTIRECSKKQVEFDLCSSDLAADTAAYGDDAKILNSPGLIPVEYGISKRKKLLLIVISAIKHLIFAFLRIFLGKNILKIFRGELWTAYQECDAILIGHDNSFSKHHLFLIIFAKLIKKPVAIYGTTIMPTVLSPRIFEIIGGRIINKVDLITTREPMTLAFLKKIGVNKAPLFCTTDKAFLLDPEQCDDIDNIFKKLKESSPGKPIVGVMLVRGSNVFKAAFSSSAPDLTAEQKYERHVEIVASTLDKLCKTIDCQFVFVPHSIGPHTEADDRFVHRDVVKKMEQSKNTTLLENDIGARKLKYLMGKFDLTISERTHGGLASATMNVPTLWISHPGDIRTYGIIGETLQFPECLYDIGALDRDTLYQKIYWTWENRDSLKEKLKTNIIHATELSMKNGTYFNDYILNKL